MDHFPPHRVPLSKKDADYALHSFKAIFARSRFGDGKEGITKLRKAYTGDLQPKDYSYVTNPYNTNDPALKKWPARLRNYNIIKPVVDSHVGEKSRRPYDPQTVVLNPDAVNSFLEEKRQVAKKYLKQLYINKIEELNPGASGMEPQELPPMAQYMDQWETSYRDQRAIDSQDALTIIKQDQEMVSKWQQMFMDYCITGRAFSYKGVSFNDVKYDHVPVEEFDFEKTPSLRYVEDAGWAIRHREMSISEVLDNWYDKIADFKGHGDHKMNGQQLLNILESPAESSSGFDITTQAGLTKLSSLDLGRSQGGSPMLTVQTDRMVTVSHPVWKGQKKIGILYYEDDLGILQTETVTEVYKPDKELGEWVEWFWVNEVWEAIVLEGKYVLDFGPVDVQRNKFNNYSVCKLPYNGLVFSQYEDEVIHSMVSAGLPYQELYNIMHYRLEFTIAKNKDKIVLMEENMIPKKGGWTHDKFMYYADALGFAFIDSTAQRARGGKQPNFNQWQVLDASLGQAIEAQFNVLAAIKAQYEEQVGFNRQRMGKALASDSVGNNERAMFQSSLITEEFFRRFEAFQDRECNGVIDVSKTAWKEGKRAMYLTPDFQSAFLSIDPETYQESEIGIVARSSSEDRDKMETMKALMQPYMQNGGQFGTIAKMLDAGNFSRLKQLVEEADRKMEQANQAAAEREERALAVQEENLANRERQAHANELEKIVLKGDKEIEKGLTIEQAKQEGAAATQVPEDRTPSWKEMQDVRLAEQKLRDEGRKHRDEMRQRKRESDQKERIETKKIKAQKQKSTTTK